MVGMIAVEGGALFSVPQFSNLGRWGCFLGMRHRVLLKVIHCQHHHLFVLQATHIQSIQAVYFAKQWSGGEEFG
jgi:hypothetical protein